jgi:hypothetical protein
MNAQRLLRHQGSLDSKIYSTAGFTAKGPARGRPFLGKRRAEAASATVSKLAPGFEKGGDMANYFGVFVFFFFFAMMTSSRFEPADQALEPMFENPRADHVSGIRDRRLIRNMFFRKIIYFSKA